MGRLASASLLVVMGLAAVRSATLIVNNPDDTEKPVGSCAGDCNLRTAWHLMEAGDTISIQVDPVMKTPITEKKAPNSFYTIQGDVKGNDGNRASLQPTATNGPGSAFQLSPLVGGIIFENLEFSNFTATPSTYAVLYLNAEGVMGPSDGDITLKNCNFYGNFGSDNGVVQVPAANSLRIDGCTFTTNKGQYSPGGLISVGSTDLVTIVDTKFDSNSFPGSMIQVVSDKFFIETTTMTGNTAIELVWTLNSLLISDSTFTRNALSTCLVYGPNVTFVQSTAELTSSDHAVYQNGASSTTSLGLNTCKFSTQTGTDVIMTAPASSETVIFNLAPKNKAITSGSDATFANCNEVQAGPLACGYGDYCVLIRKAGKAVGYLCLTGEEAADREYATA